MEQSSAFNIYFSEKSFILKKKYFVFNLKILFLSRVKWFPLSIWVLLKLLIVWTIWRRSGGWWRRVRRRSRRANWQILWIGVNWRCALSWHNWRCRSWYGWRSRRQSWLHVRQANFPVCKVHVMIVQLIVELVMKLVHLVILSQVLANLRMTVLVVCYNNIARVGCRDTSLAVVFSR